MLICILSIICMMILRIMHHKVLKFKKKGIQLQDLDFHIQAVRFETRECILNFMKHAAELSNNNLVRNSNALMQSKDAKIDKEDFSWINNSLTQAESKFKLCY